MTSTTATAAVSTVDSIVSAAMTGDDTAAAAYVTADVKTKAGVRTALDKIMRTALGSGDAATAMAAHAAATAMTAAKAPAEPVDVDALVAEKIIALRIATAMISSVGVDGVECDLARVATLVDAALQVAPTAAQVDAANKIVGAVKITTDRAASTDLTAHFAEIRAAVEPGTEMTCSQIAQYPTQARGDRRVSPGGVAVRLFPASGAACNLTGVVPVAATATSPRLARFV